MMLATCVCLFLTLSLGGLVSSEGSKGPQLCKDPVCYYEWHLHWERSMSHRQGRNTYNIILNEIDDSLSIASNMYRQNDPMVGTRVDKHQTLTADAYPRDMITINGEFPGPTISVMEGSTVEVTVTNHLLRDETSIHFYGMKQFGSHQKDGVPFVNQCPIRPGQTYTYKFTATPAGTHFYHSAYQSQRADGLAGMLIVHRREPILPEMLMVVSDWTHVPGKPRERGNPWHIDWPGTGEYEPKPHDSRGVIVFDVSDTSELDGNSPQVRPLYADIDDSQRQAEGERAPLDEKELHIPEGTDLTNQYVWRKNAYNPYSPYGSGYKNSYVLNGRGRGDGNYYPLHRFFVEPGLTYRFRCVHVGALNGLKISIDEHQLRVVATDGSNVNPNKVDFLYISPGESYDFEVDMLQTPGRYWVRLWVQEHYQESPDGLGQLGVLTYLPEDGDDDDMDPTSKPRTCTESQMCTGMNCQPHTLHDFNTTCIDLQQLVMLEDHGQNMYQPSPDDDYDEYFLNFAASYGPTVDGYMFVDPTAVPSPGEITYMKCTDRCTFAPCHCTYSMAFEGNKTIQLVLSNFDGNQGDTVFGHHSVHLHGHSFYVMKQGYPIYDKQVMTVKLANTDIACDDIICRHAVWRHEPEYNYDNPVKKDSIVIPMMGYVVIRFKADNPGLWMMDSQDTPLLRGGMRLLTTVSSPTETWTRDELPRCGEDAFIPVATSGVEILTASDDFDPLNPDTPNLRPFGSVPCPEISLSPDDMADMIGMSTTAFAFAIVGSLAIGALVCLGAFYYFIKQMSSGAPTGTASTSRTPLLRDYE